MTASSELAIQRQIQRAANSKPTTRLFRNQVGQSWAGSRVTKGTNGMMFVPSNAVIVHDARPVKYGFPPGSADLLGWHRLVITEEHVGKGLAVFASVEVKTPTGRVAPTQRTWLTQVRKSGGIAGVARSVAELDEILGGPLYSWEEAP